MKKQQIPILFEDDQLIVVNKPAGLPTIPDRYDPSLPNLKARVEKTHGKVWVVHRIDADTTGVLCFARTAEAHRALSMQFEHREVAKTYLALVDGHPEPPEGTIDQPIGSHPTQAGKMIVSKKGKASISHYKVLETLGPGSLVEVQIETGRTHQVRVHMQYLRTPLWVDPMYGNRDAFYLSELKGRKYRLGKFEEERPLLSRLSLHAYQLRINQPESGQPMTFEAPLPKDLTATIKQLRKWT